jgi:tetratricopeptide (TPR) repeat protein
MIKNTKQSTKDQDDNLAINLISNAIKQDPKNAILYQNLAESLYNLKEYILAKKNAQTALDLNPLLVKPYIILSNISNYYEKDFQKSYEFAETAYQLDNESYYSNKCFGVANINLNNNEIGVTYLEKALSISPEDNELYTYLFISYGRLKNYFQIHRIAKKIYEIYPSIYSGYLVIDTFISMKQNNTKFLRILFRILVLAGFVGGALFHAYILFIFPLIDIIRFFLSGVILIKFVNKISGIIRIVYSLVVLIIIIVILVQC